MKYDVKQIAIFILKLLLAILSGGAGGAAASALL